MKEQHAMRRSMRFRPARADVDTVARSQRRRVVVASALGGLFGGAFSR